MKVLERPVAKILADEPLLREVRTSLEAKECIVVRDDSFRSLCEPLTAYLERILVGSLPNYRAIEPGCPNFYRLSFEDERAYVRGHFRQISFFPWNQDLFNLFSAWGPLFQLKNALAGMREDRFLGHGHWLAVLLLMGAVIGAWGV